MISFTYIFVRTAENHIRPAGNSWHLVDYSPTNGSVLSVCNCPQGLDQLNGALREREKERGREGRSRERETIRD